MSLPVSSLTIIIISSSGSPSSMVNGGKSGKNRQSERILRNMVELLHTTTGGEALLTHGIPYCEIPCRRMLTVIDSCLSVDPGSTRFPVVLRIIYATVGPINSVE